MVEISIKQMSGIIVTVLVLAGGGTYYLQETGSYMNCPGGWILREDGMYDCASRNINPQWCHHGSEEGPENIGYRCYLGIPLDMKEPKPIEGSSKDFTTSPDGKICYIHGDLRLGGSLENDNCKII